MIAITTSSSMRVKPLDLNIKAPGVPALIAAGPPQKGSPGMLKEPLKEFAIFVKSAGVGTLNRRRFLEELAQ